MHVDPYFILLMHAFNNRVYILIWELFAEHRAFLLPLLPLLQPVLLRILNAEESLLYMYVPLAMCSLVPYACVLCLHSSVNSMCTALKAAL